VFDLLAQGGPIMWIFPVLSVVALAVIVERFFYLNLVEKDKDRLILEWQKAWQSQQWDSFLGLCHVSLSPLATLLKDAYEHRNEAPAIYKETVQQKLESLLPLLDKHVVVLGTISNIAPLLGLLGTVLGNIEAFNVLNRLQGIGDPAKLAEGIATALLTTVGGIVVAVPAIIFYNYFVARINRLETELRGLVGQITALREARP